MKIKEKLDNLKKKVITHKKEIVIGSVGIAGLITFAVLCKKGVPSETISADKIKDIMFPDGEKLELTEEILKLGVTDIRNHDVYMDIWMDHGGIGPTLGELGDFGKQLMKAYDLRDDYHIEGLVTLEKY